MTSRDRYLRSKYGITEAEHDAILAAQNGVCAICFRKPGKYRLGVDHDHAKDGRASVRGLICATGDRSCNTALGRLGDQPSAMQHVLNYLTDPPAQRVLRALEEGE